MDKDIMAWTDFGLKIGGAAITLLAFIFGWLHWSLRKEVVTRDDFSKYRNDHDAEHRKVLEELHDIDVRFTRMESAITHLPTREDIQRISDLISGWGREIEAVRGDIREMRADVRAIGRDVDLLMEGHLGGVA